MIVLDTNVVSEVLGSRPDPRVVAWLDEQPPDQVFTTAITVAELLSGVALLPHGARRAALGVRVARFLTGPMEGKVLDFDSDAALEYADVRRVRRDLGRPIDPLDAQIAAIARARGGTVATRNVRDFDGTGAAVENPWSS